MGGARDIEKLILIILINANLGKYAYVARRYVRNYIDSID